MKLIIDDANIEKIKKLYDIFPIDGVTTNPTILAKNEKDPYTTLKEIRSFIGEDSELHVQVISKNSKDMIAEAHRIIDTLGKNTFIKVPTFPEGIKAMKELSKNGFHLTATAIYTPMQAYVAAKSGANYVAPYVNRIDNLGSDGVQATKDIHDILENNGLKTEVLAASFKNTKQVQELCIYGIGAATIAPEIIEGFVNIAAVDLAIHDFIKDFETLCGDGSTM